MNNPLILPPFIYLYIGWGSGKSFTMKLIENSIINIQKSYRATSHEQYKYCGHIYMSGFRAWDYAKGDIWSSIMYQLLHEPTATVGRCLGKIL